MPVINDVINISMWVTTVFIVSLTNASTKLGHYQGIRIVATHFSTVVYYVCWRQLRTVYQRVFTNRLR